MAESDPPQLRRRNDAAHRVEIGRKHLAQTGMKHQRFVAEDEKLVEGEAGRRRNVGNEGRQPVDPVGDFADLGFHDFLQAMVTVAAGAGDSTMDIAPISLYIYV